jgi:hypothetical protein
LIRDAKHERTIWMMDSKRSLSKLYAIEMYSTMAEQATTCSDFQTPQIASNLQGCCGIKRRGAVRLARFSARNFPWEQPSSCIDRQAALAEGDSWRSATMVTMHQGVDVRDFTGVKERNSNRTSIWTRIFTLDYYRSVPPEEIGVDDFNHVLDVNTAVLPMACRLQIRHEETRASWPPSGLMATGEGFMQ